MKNIISKTSVKSVIAVIGSVFSALIFPTLSLAMSQMEAGALAVRGSDQPLALFGATGIFTVISNTAMFLIGALCVLMVVFGGFRYVISGGDAAKVTSAKNTILYAIIGVIVAVLAYAIVSFVTTSLGVGSPSNSINVTGTNV